MKPDITVIIPFYGSKEDLRRCIEGLCTQTFSYPYEIIILESGCDPEIKAMVSKIPNAYLTSSEDTMAPGRARNLGVKFSNSSFLAFIDADCIPEKNWLVEVYRSLQDYQIVLGPVLNLYPLHPIASVDNLLQFVDFQKYRNSVLTHFPACNLGITKDLFLKSSGFPEELLTGEDIIFSEKAISLSNGSIYYNKNQRVRHSGRKKFSGFLKHNEVLGFYRGYLNLKLPKDRNTEGNLLLRSVYYTTRRLIYIIVRTLQWNPAGILRIILYFPLVVTGLYAWGVGFREGTGKRGLSEEPVTANWQKGYK